MSIERLEEIIENLPYSIRYVGNVETLIKYTREQAVRALKNADDLHVMELQLASEQKENKRDHQRIQEIEAKNWESIVQNKRYHEAMQELKEYLESTIPKIPSNEKP